jgi:ATP-dependent DNA helicase RecQ/Werner syndrome ATP-dependent helicase
MATDEFDDDFLADFDVDAAVRARQTAASTPNKRLKVTPSPAVQSSTALHAARSLFGENSPFSEGYTTNPLKELATTSYAPETAPASETTAPVDEKALEQTLQTYFGHNKYRPGQLEVLQAILSSRDAAVFWATGSGKSICYQIPALHTGNVSLVVSPLISLMQDQVNKINGLSEEPLATFLGSAQTNASEEAAALAGKYRLVYVTPEKLLSGGFLDQLARMHTITRPLSLIAIDESHCVSEWGHDFRVDYRQLHQIRNHPVLSQVPLVALTATAVPRVQKDILQALSLRNPLIVRQSFDRTNLKIEVHKKKGIHAAMEPLLSKMAQQSTIVYAPTRDQVEQISNFLAQKLPHANVEAYHAGLSHEQRTRAHTNFLVGHTKVIVATVAFGMGIDKPDTRRVVHYGPPKTVEGEFVGIYPPSLTDVLRR